MFPERERKNEDERPERSILPLQGRWISGVNCEIDSSRLAEDGESRTSLTWLQPELEAPATIRDRGRPYRGRTILVRLQPQIGERSAISPALAAANNCALKLVANHLLKTKGGI